MRIALVWLLLAGCASAPSPTPMPPATQPMNIVWQAGTYRQIWDVCTALAGQPSYACVVVRGPNCMIFSPVIEDERDQRSLALLGHELMQCHQGTEMFRQKKDGATGKGVVSTPPGRPRQSEPASGQGAATVHTAGQAYHAKATGLGRDQMR